MEILKLKNAIFVKKAPTTFSSPKTLVNLLSIYSFPKDFGLMYIE